MAYMSPRKPQEYRETWVLEQHLLYPLWEIIYMPIKSERIKNVNISGKQH